MIAEHLYNSKDQKGHKLYKDYHMGYFFAQLIYALLKKFKFQPNWPKVR